MNTSKFHVNRVGVLGTLAYPVTGLLLWFSLALHLRLGLGKWPESIGVDPGTALFRAHAWATGLLLWPGLFIVPVAAGLGLLFALIPRTRKWAVYPFIFVGTCLLAFGVMQLAPDAFINWWLD